MRAVAGTGFRLYDTVQAKVVPFVPSGRTVRMYTCGLTPNEPAHVGHAATFLAYDVLQRRLRDLGFRTRCVRNVTDVDDDMMARSKALGIPFTKLANQVVAGFNRSIRALGLLPCYSEPWASSAITEIRRLTARLLEKGHAYVIEGSVFFAVETFRRFGQVSGLDGARMLLLARERGGNPEDPRKRHPLDFMLWQGQASANEPASPSPWGPGRPGWHIECSALALRELRTPTMDLHGGGADLVFPHHECSAAQSEAATGRPLARHWMHVGMVRLGGEKMSKSLGNVVPIETVLESWPPAAVRLALLSNHYRPSWEWHNELLATAAERLARWRHTGEGVGGLEEARRALDEDLDTPAALAALDRAARANTGVSVPARTLLGVDVFSGAPLRHQASLAVIGP